MHSWSDGGRLVSHMPTLGPLSLPLSPPLSPFNPLSFPFVARAGAGWRSTPTTEGVRHLLPRALAAHIPDANGLVEEASKRRGRKGEGKAQGEGMKSLF